MSIQKISTERDAQNETTFTWFKVAGESWGIAANDDGSVQLLDSEGYGIDECNDHDGVKLLLSKLTKNH